jgi:hypothetical protein
LVPDATSQISIDGGETVQVPVALHVTELEFVCCPDAAAAQNVVPSVEPSATYPGQFTAVHSVPFAVFDPATDISRRAYGGVAVSTDPPPVPGVIVHAVDEVNRAVIRAFTLA